MRAQPRSIREHLSFCADWPERFLWSGPLQVSIDRLRHGTSLIGGIEQLAGRSILLSTRDQLAAAVALAELDGVASRIVICPPDISKEHIPGIVAAAEVNAIVSDYETGDRAWTTGLIRVRCEPTATANDYDGEPRATEWVLLTSGTTGAPKMIVHTFASLTAPIEIHCGEMRDGGVVWGTFYDFRRYGGLQVLLRAILGCGSLVLSSPGEAVGDHLVRLAAHGVTHLSGTPSHWRRALMSPHAREIAPKYVRLSGEIADQAVLNALRALYPASGISHAFASTEAGVAFEVTDGLEGFPARLLGASGDVELKIRDTGLTIRSNRTASRYLDRDSGRLADEAGFVDTGDVVQLRGNRYYFLGRRNGVINVGGLKVYPEEVEAVINRHPAVRMSRVAPRRNSLMGALVSADVVLKESYSACDFQTEIVEMCRQSLAPHKIPAVIRSVPMLEVASAGKIARHHA